MTDKEKLTSILNLVTNTAGRLLLPPLVDKDFNVYDYSGGNFDDAYDLGFDAGETSLAREIVEIIESK